MQRTVFIVSVIIMIVAVICMGINEVMSVFSDNAIRIIGGIVIVDVFALTYSTMKLRNSSK